jgi:predicted enzyme related to lactoylglutathione lyase
MPDYAPGTPSWVDLASPDLDKSKEFYSQLFGWKTETIEDPQAGNYTMASIDGKLVAGLAPTFSPDQPSAWNMYVSTTDADSTAQKVRDAGGTVVAEPMEVMGQGRLAVFQDSTGAFVSTWQPEQMKGADLVNEVGSFGWSELYTRDVPAAKAFYEKVFGWTTHDNDMGGGFVYTEFKVDGRSVAGGLDMSQMLPAEVPPHWLIYFGVANADEAAEKTKQLGGEVVDGPKEIPIGRFAVLKDPVGAHFAIWQAKQG